MSGAEPVNVDYKVTDDNKLMIEVDLNQMHGPSASGKTLIIATTRSQQFISENTAFNLNVFRYMTKR